MPSEAFAPPLPANDVRAPEGFDTATGWPEDLVFAATTSSAVLDLIESPCRALEVEYKSWRNLDHAEDRAELARDIAALANHGGGHIVFGFDELTLSPDEADPFRTVCSADRVASIVRDYLDPPVACDVLTPMSSAGVFHPVIRVASHGITPVCIREDGPTVAGAKLIERGAFYIRKHGPAARGEAIGVPIPHSGRIEVPQDWLPLIRRCVRRDREALLGMLEATIDGHVAAPDTAHRLLTWHRAARAAFLSVVPNSPYAETLGRSHYSLSYAFDLIRPEMLEHAQFPERLRRTVFEVQTRFRSGWNMFDPPYRRGIHARFMTDPATGDEETDFLETAWLRARNPNETSDFWRVSPRGFATIVRGYAEDAANSDASTTPILPGTCLSPETLAQDVAELVCHASTFARLFTGVRQVLFRCEWWGLAGRELYDPSFRWPHRGPALGDHCVAALQIPVARLVNGWPEIVAQLIAPALRAIEPDIRLTGDWVRGQAPSWAVAPE